MEVRLLAWAAIAAVVRFVFDHLDVILHYLNS